MNTHILKQLRAARALKGLSQRELSARVGLQQGHISRIENGSVDPQLSNVVELARVLDLEVMLVPRSALAAVEEIVRTQGNTLTIPIPEPVQSDLKRLRKKIRILLRQNPGSTELQQLDSTVSEVLKLSPGMQQLDTIRTVIAVLGSFDATSGRSESQSHLQQVLQVMRRLRNQLAHASTAHWQQQDPQPMYTLDDEEDGE